MELSVEKIGDVSVAVVPGETLDAGCAKDFKAAAAPLLTPGAKVIAKAATINNILVSWLIIRLLSVVLVRNPFQTDQDRPAPPSVSTPELSIYFGSNDFKHLPHWC